MIRSMTAFGAASAESELGSVTVEIRTVNSRYLDINLRVPDEMRMAEASLREQIGLFLKRGKVDARVAFARAATNLDQALSDDYLQMTATQLKRVREFLPETPAPTLSELIKGASASENTSDPKAWTELCVQAATQALTDLQANREREGARLAQAMLENAQDIAGIVASVQTEVPRLLDEHRQKLATKLRETLEAASPSGLAQISGEELSARIAQESSLFALRIDVAEELTRLQSHIDELRHLLQDDSVNTPQAARGARKSGKAGGSVGKRLDFLFQEMNREANTLGSKAGALNMTRAAIDLKLLIEQMREQAQNIE